MAGGRQQRTERMPITASFSTPRWARRTLWGVVGLSLIFCATPGYAQVRTNRNVPTWTWADEVVQPQSNIATPKNKPNVGSPTRVIIRQLIRQAREAASQGKLDAAESLAKRADLLLKEATATDPDAWDASEQPPASFLRQLAEFRSRQVPQPALPKPTAEKDPESAVAKPDSIAPAPPALELGELEKAEDPLEGDYPELAPQTKTDQAATHKPHDLSPQHGLHPHLAGEAGARSARSTAARHAKNGADGSGDESTSIDGDSSEAFAPPAASSEHNLDSADDRTVAAAPPPPVTERIIQIQDSPEKSSSSMLAAAMVHLLSTAAGIVLGILVLVGVRTFLKRQYNADFGFVFRVEHVATGEDGAYLPYPFFPGMQAGEPLPMPTAGPGRAGVAAVLTELPAGFQSDEISPYEEQLRKEEEAENEMMKLVLQQNLELREALGGRNDMAA